MSTFRYLFVLLIIVSGVMVLNFKFMTNAATPGGDGKRIFSYIHFVDNSESFYPLWNQYKVGGVPTLADPERFVWLAKLVDSKSKYANLQLNLVFISVIVFVGFSVVLLSLELNLSTVAAVLSSFVFITSWVFERWVICGRINILIAWAIICLALVCCIRWLKGGKFYYFILMSLMTGKLMHDLGYYGLFMFGPFICLVFCYYGYQKYGLNRAIVAVPLQIGFMCVLSILSYAVFLFPLVDYIATNLAAYYPLFTLVDELPYPAGIINIFFPFYEIGLTKSFRFVSAVCFPLLFFVIIDKLNKKNVSIIFLFILLPNIIVLLGKIYPFKHIVDILVSNAFLSQIRQPIAFYFPVTLCLAVLCGFGYDSISRVAGASDINLKKKYLFYIIIISIIFLALLIYPKTDNSSVKFFSQFYRNLFDLEKERSKVHAIIVFMVFAIAPLFFFKSPKSL